MGKVLEYFGPVSMFPDNVHLQIPNMTKPLMLGTLRVDQCILPIDKYTKMDFTTPKCYTISIEFRYQGVLERLWKCCTMMNSLSSSVYKNSIADLFVFSLWLNCRDLELLYEEQSTFYNSKMGYINM